MSELKKASLSTIADGVATELFEREMGRVCRNIGDKNTSWKEKRKITLEFSFQPDESRDEVICHVTAKSKLAPVKSYKKTVFLGKMNGELSLFDRDTKQIDMFDNGVTAIPSKEEKEA